MYSDEFDYCDKLIIDEKMNLMVKSDVRKKYPINQYISFKTPHNFKCNFYLKVNE